MIKYRNKLFQLKKQILKEISKNDKNIYYR